MSRNRCQWPSEWLKPEQAWWTALSAVVIPWTLYTYVVVTVDSPFTVCEKPLFGMSTALVVLVTLCITVQALLYQSAERNVRGACQSALILHLATLVVTITAFSFLYADAQCAHLTTYSCGRHNNFQCSAISFAGLPDPQYRVGVTTQLLAVCGLFASVWLLIPITLFGLELIIALFWGFWYVWSRSFFGPKLEWIGILENVLGWVNKAFVPPPTPDTIDRPYKPLPLYLFLTAVVVPITGSVVSNAADVQIVCTSDDRSEDLTIACYTALGLMLATTLATALNYTSKSPNYLDKRWPVVPISLMLLGLSSIGYSLWLMTVAGKLSCSAMRQQALLCGLATFFMALWDVAFRICWSILSLILIVVRPVFLRCCDVENDALLSLWWDSSTSTISRAPIEPANNENPAPPPDRIRTVTVPTNEHSFRLDATL